MKLEIFKQAIEFNALICRIDDTPQARTELENKFHLSAFKRITPTLSRVVVLGVGKKTIHARANAFH